MEHALTCCLLYNIVHIALSYIRNVMYASIYSKSRVNHVFCSLGILWWLGYLEKSLGRWFTNLFFLLNRKIRSQEDNGFGSVPFTNLLPLSSQSIVLELYLLSILPKYVLRFVGRGRWRDTARGKSSLSGSPTVLLPAVSFCGLCRLGSYSTCSGQQHPVASGAQHFPMRTSTQGRLWWHLSGWLSLATFLLRVPNLPVSACLDPRKMFPVC